MLFCPLLHPVFPYECIFHDITFNGVKLIKIASHDAFFCINDEVAAYCLQLIKSAGFKIPQDISVCGFTNSYITEVTDPTLTSVDQHGFEMGRTAARLLINRIEGKETRGGIVSKVIKTDLVVRNSTK